MKMSNADWFAKKLGVQPQQPVVYPQNTPPTQMAPKPATYVAPPQSQYPPSQQATPQAPTCPSCRSNNYSVAAKQITQNGEVESWRCYDCGYPKVQAGSGVGTVGQSTGPARAAKQVPTGGWNPTTIIGHI